MAGRDFRSFSDESRKRMNAVARSWGRMGLSTETLQEGLALLKSDSRPSAEEVLKSQPALADIACSYGKGWRCRLSLSKDEAEAMHRLVFALRTAASGEEEAKRMVGVAFDVLIGGSRMPGTLGDPSWKPLLDVLSSFDPSVRQTSLV